MILDVLIFVLGALVAGLLALAALPALWRRAMRLSEARLSRLVPLSAGEIAAEQDHLRAAHAVELRRTEQRMERAEAERAALRIEAARREQRILELHDEDARARSAIADLEADRAALRREVDGLWAENGAEAIALHGLAELAETRLRDIAVLQAERDRLGQDADRSRSSVAGLETRLLGAETRNEDLRRELAQVRRDAAAAAETVAAERDAAAAAAPRVDLGRLLDARDHEVEGLRTELAFMAEQAASAERRATEATKAYTALTAERETAAGVAAAPAGGADASRLRAAIAALADDVLRLGRSA